MNFQPASRFLVLPLVGLFAIGLSPNVVGQSLSEQSRVAMNDKIQKSQGPYRIAVAQTLGRKFYKAHEPIVERRQWCKTSGGPAECVVLTLPDSELSEGQIQQLVSIVREVCRFVGEQGIRIVLHREDSGAADPIVVDRNRRLQRACTKQVIPTTVVTIHREAKGPDKVPILRIEGLVQQLPNTGRN